MNKNFWLKFNKPILALAPMAGITDSAFRQICGEYGADVTYSEMASVSALFYKPQKTLELVRFKKKERPYVVQLFGNNPKHFAVATKIITEKIKPEGIDINFGCPAKKVFRHGSGCALLSQISLSREIISAVCENTSLPVSIKIRAGLKNFSALNFIEKTQDLPYSAIMIHGRTYEKGFSGEVDFEIGQKIKKRFPQKIILGNGGIDSPEKARDILKKFPLLDGLGIARGSWGRPFFFSQTKDLIKKGKYATYSFPKIKKIMFRHAKLMYKDKGDRGFFEIRKHLSWYVKDFPGAKEIRKNLVLVKKSEEIEKILNDRLRI